MQEKQQKQGETQWCENQDEFGMELIPSLRNLAWTESHCHCANIRIVVSVHTQKPVAITRCDFKAREKGSVNCSNSIRSARTVHVVDMHDDESIVALVEAGVEGGRDKAKRQ